MTEVNIFEFLISMASYGMIFGIVLGVYIKVANT